MNHQQSSLVAFLLFLLSFLLSSAQDLDACPGYNSVNVTTTATGLNAILELAGVCNAFGPDLERLALSVEYESDTRIHLKISDPSSVRYEVPTSIFPRPSPASTPPQNPQIKFNITSTPFSFRIFRSGEKEEILFDTTSHPLIFAPQYWRVKTSLPFSPNIYGLGEHTETFRLPSENTTRTLWSRDAFGVPPGTNLYGNHPVYFDHRLSGTHGVFLLNSNGMDIKLTSSEASGATLEYNVIGGIIDLYFLAGSETSPVEVAKQYAEIVGTPAEVPYWSLGFHQCRFGYKDFVDVAQVITNYSDAGIPLETMWTDIDYMDDRKIFTTDPQYFPIPRMREIVQFLHDHSQHYILMVDPAVAYLPGTSYTTLDNGLEDDVFLKNKNGSVHLGVVWPGVTVYPDWFHPNVTSFWNGEFERFFSPDTGIDIDGVWIDMNEPASFCAFPCTDPFQQAREQDLPPARTSPPPDPNAPIFQGQSTSQPTSSSSNVKRREFIWNEEVVRRQNNKRQTSSDQDLLNPPYTIQNAAGVLGDRTAHVDTVHFNGSVEYDTHNLFGTMMSTATRSAMLARRPSKRTLVITRSTFAGAGAHVGKWLGDNLSDWEHYRNSIAGMLGMASVYQVPMVGADVCGFGGNTTDKLCARWAMLGAFYPFYRNHNQDTSIGQEFYRWPIVAEAAKNAIDARYRLLDYIYTAFHQAKLDGTPILSPLWFQFPQDERTFGIDAQFFYGPGVLVSPVTAENETRVDIYLPPTSLWYEFDTWKRVDGGNVSLTDVSFTQIPLHVIGGTILPLRAKSAMTTILLMEQPLEIVVLPDKDGKAKGSLYVDDGESITQPSSTLAKMTFSDGVLELGGTFAFTPAPKISTVIILGVDTQPTSVKIDGENKNSSWDGATKKLVVSDAGLDLKKGAKLEIQL